MRNSRSCRQKRGHAYLVVKRSPRVRVRRRRMQGGFLPLLVPLIAAAIGAAPGIASAVIAAKNARQ